MYDPEVNVEWNIDNFEFITFSGLDVIPVKERDMSAQTFLMNAAG